MCVHEVLYGTEGRPVFVSETFNQLELGAKRASQLLDVVSFHIQSAAPERPVRESKGCDDEMPVRSQRTSYILDITITVTGIREKVKYSSVVPYIKRLLG